jgi:lipid-A-disaccharide synthase
MAAFDDIPLRTIIVEDTGDKFSAMAACDVGLAASGTVTLELAMARVPYVAAYKVATVTHWLASILVQVPYANLINFISNREVVPECIQSRCEPDMLFGHICRLLDGAGAGQVNAMRPALEAIGLGSVPPSERAAAAVLQIINKRIK